MKRERSLLSRIDSADTIGRYTTKVSVDEMLDNISDNVQHMLNVRLGSVKALDDYGMPDFNDVVKEFPDAITRIRSVIKSFLDKYEPRLSNVVVTHIHDPHQPLLLKFSIAGNIKVNNKASKVSFNTVLTGAGQATVKA